MPELASPLSGQIRVLDYGPQSVTPPPPLPPNLTNLAKAQIMQTLSKELAELPAEVIAKYQEGQQLGLQADAVDVLGQKLKDRDKNLSYDSSGMVSYAPERVESPLTIQLAGERVKTEQARQKAYETRQQFQSVPRPPAVKPTTYDLIKAEIESGYQTDPTVADVAINPASLEAPLPDADPEADAIRFDDAGDLVPSDATDEAAALYPDQAQAAAEQVGQQLLTIPPEELTAQAGSGPVRPATSVAAAPVPADVFPEDAGIPTGSHIRRDKKQPNRWLDTSNGTVSMLRDDGVILDLLPGQNWKARPKTGQDTKGKGVMSDAQKKSLQSAADLTKDMADIEGRQKELFSQNKAGPIMGRINDAIATVGYGDEDYVSANGDIKVANFRIARLLNGPGVLTDKDIARAQEVAPTLNETPESFSAKMKSVRKSLATSIENWKLINAGQSTEQQIALADSALAQLGQQSSGATAQPGGPEGVKGEGTRQSPFRVETSEQFKALPAGVYFTDGAGTLRRTRSK